MKQVRDLYSHRRSRGLTQTDLALLLGLTQQAIAKWEQTNLVPEHHLKDVARHLRVPVEVLLAKTEGSAAQQAANLRAQMEDFFSDQVVICFDDLCLHYCPTSEELAEFWISIQRGAFAHLSAGPVQVLINVGEALRVDISEDPPLNTYRPSPINPCSSPTEPEEEIDETASKEPKFWFDHGYARVYVRGAMEPYTGPQTIFTPLMDRTDITKLELAKLAEDFESERTDFYSIFHLFQSVIFSMELDASEYDKGQSLHPDSLHLFQSEDEDSVPQQTWIHTKNIRAIEVPTRFWKIYELGLKAQLAEIEERASPSKVASGAASRRGAKSPRASKPKSQRN